jgi:hypothetical protein
MIGDRAAFERTHATRRLSIADDTISLMGSRYGKLRHSDA